MNLAPLPQFQRNVRIESKHSSPRSRQAALAFSRCTKGGSPTRASGLPALFLPLSPLPVSNGSRRDRYPDAITMEGIDSSKASPGDLPHGYEPLVGNLGKLLDTGDFSDLQITCDDFQWAVHKAIICTQSDFFNACSKNFKEAEEGVIKLPDDNKHAVDALITYLYKADYDDELAVEDFSPTVFSVHVNTIADKYNIQGLATLAAAKVARRATTEWNTSAFADAIEEMYKTSPESKKGMQKHIVDIAAKHIKELRSKVFGIRFREISDTIAPFSAALLERILDPSVKSNDSHLKGMEHYKCGHCLRKLSMESVDGDSYAIRTCCYCSGRYHERSWAHWQVDEA
ncbi:hypothetical protein HII31_09166 [Pseudocercospora fuligena]|uniref:BTB domain-containing protein n=1 Tax=Pseudocercospora fuligena TaxID=685502 RepID=A0A8H6RBG2_9PEZI|nr:hypothetical protein HII31_09166 [Pseudocercospora fuligena]